MLIFIMAYPITVKLSFSVKGKRRQILVRNLGIPFELTEISFSDTYSLLLSVFRATVNGAPRCPLVVHMLSCHVGPWQHDESCDPVALAV